MRKAQLRAARLNKRFKVAEYRHAYVDASARRTFAQQVRSMRDARGWSQVELARRMGTKQAVISRIEDPSYGRLTVRTMLEIAKVFDVALFVRLMSWPDFIQASALSEQALRPKSFVEEEPK